MANKHLINLNAADDGLFTDFTEDTFAQHKIVLGAYRSIRPAALRRKTIGYVSMPISSGKRMYDVLEKYGVRSLGELGRVSPESVYGEVIQPNIEAGIALADDIGIRDEILYIAPSVFEAKAWKWSQDAYMALWYRVIEELAGRVVMMDDWAYSNGGTQELVRVFEMGFGLVNPANGRMKLFPDDADFAAEYAAMRNVRVYTQDGDEIALDGAIQKVANAIINISERGFPAKSLLASLRRLTAIYTLLGDPTLMDETEHMRRGGPRRRSSYSSCNPSWINVHGLWQQACQATGESNTSTSFSSPTWWHAA